MSNKSILVCGEALIDLFVSEGAKGLETKAVLGGSPFNVAIALSRLGQKSAFYGGLSTDSFGLSLSRKLQMEGVDLAYTVHSPRLSTISVVATDATGHPAYAFHGEGKADRDLKLDDLPDLQGDIDTLTFGSYTIAVSPVGETYLALAKREARRRIISIDPNLRPTVTPNMQQWRSRFEAFLPFANIVKASDEDLAVAYDGLTDFSPLAEAWHRLGVQLVVVTRGSKGAVGFLRGQPPLVVPGRVVNVIDTVGAGDTFHAALLTSLRRRGRLSLSELAGLNVAELRGALRYAVVASSITCTRQGADVPTAEDVEQALAQFAETE